MDLLMITVTTINELYRAVALLPNKPLVTMGADQFGYDTVVGCELTIHEGAKNIFIGLHENEKYIQKLADTYESQ